MEALQDDDVNSFFFHFFPSFPSKVAYVAIVFICWNRFTVCLVGCYCCFYAPLFSCAVQICIIIHTFPYVYIMVDGCYIAFCLNSLFFCKNRLYECKRPFADGFISLAMNLRYMVLGFSFRNFSQRTFL